jgi:transcriptional regulator with XRE-family HTH domain
MAMSIGQRIVHMRKQKNWNQRELAEKLEISPRQLVRWELDQVQIRPKSIAKLAKALETTPENLIAAPSNGAKRIEDEELRELLDYIPELEPRRLDALKMMLKDIITCDQFNRFRSRQGRQALG